jgi:hypothetical protein
LSEAFPKTIPSFGKSSNNTGFVNVGTSRDTPDFAVESITRRRHGTGKHTFFKAAKLLITRDCGGSTGIGVNFGNSDWRN